MKTENFSKHTSFKSSFWPLINMQNTRYFCIRSLLPYERRSMQLYWLSDTIGVSDQLSPEDVGAFELRGKKYYLQ